MSSRNRRKHAPEQLAQPPAEIAEAIGCTLSYAAGSVPPAPEIPSMLEIFARGRMNDDTARVVGQMSVLAEFAQNIKAIRSQTEITVGPVSIVIADGQVDGMRIGYNGEIARYEPLELMEIGAFCYALGVQLRNAELIAEGVEAGV